MKSANQQQRAQFNYLSQSAINELSILSQSLKVIVDLSNEGATLNRDPIRSLILRSHQITTELLENI